MQVHAIFRCLVAASLFALLVGAGSVSASPGAPVSITTPPPGTSFSPGFRSIADFAIPYVEEEYFIAGSADVYSYTTDPPVRGNKIPVASLPYQTRFIVRRPADAADFNGTVVIEWWNSTAQFDTAPAYDASADYFGRKGIVYVGFTNAQSALGYLVVGCPQLGTGIPQCPGRYAPLASPFFGLLENGQAYEIGSQLANVLKNGPNSPLPAGFSVERVYHTGQSQQGGSVTTYSGEFHFPGVNDGYFIQAAGGRARPLSGASPTFPASDPDGRAPTNLPVPVIRAQTETDMFGVLFGGTRQTDTPTFRYYELSGVAHNVVHKDIEAIPAGVFTPFPIFLEDVCEFPMNTSGDGPVFGSFLYNAMWENMDLQVRFGIEPPQGDLIATGPGGIARDAFGNALGGIRLPQMDVPIATYVPSNSPNPLLPPFPPPLDQLGNLICRLSGAVFPFDAATLSGLYANHGSYVSQIVKETIQLKKDRFLLDEEAETLTEEAAASSIGE
jgi:hypothetical protein